MKILILSTVVLFMYMGLSWFSLRNEIPKSYSIKSFFGASSITVFLLCPSIAINLFWSLFIAVLILVIALYIESARKESNGKLIKNGVFGGLWLTVPIYAYLATNT